jgi:hypothetical protein
MIALRHSTEIFELLRCASDIAETGTRAACWSLRR